MLLNLKTCELNKKQFDTQVTRLLFTWGKKIIIFIEFNKYFVHAFHYLQLYFNGNFISVEVNGIFVDIYLIGACFENMTKIVT